MTRINIAPTRRESARITAYILGSHANGNAYDFGNYNKFTELEENALFATYNKIEEIADVYKIGGLNFWQDAPKAHKAKLILSVYRGVKAQLEKEGN